MTLLLYMLSPKEIRSLKAEIRRINKITGKGSSDKPLNERLSDNSYDVNDDIIKASLRLSSRIFVGGSIVLTILESVQNKFRRETHTSPLKSKSNTKYSIPLSLSTLILLHRLLYRLFTKLRQKLLEFPHDNSNTTNRWSTKAILSSSIAPSCAAALSGVALFLIPEDGPRLSISIYAFARALEYLYNASGISSHVPWWFGSWLLFPFSTGQLFHALFYNNDTVPGLYQNTFMKFPNTNLTSIGEFPSPSNKDIVEGISEISSLKFPPYKSPALFPQSSSNSNKVVNSLLITAHPAIKQLSCALLHPKKVSCSKTYLSFIFNQFGKNAKVIFVLYSLLSIPRYKQFIKVPLTSFLETTIKTLRTSAFLTLTVATAWSGICLSQRVFPRSMLPGQRFYLSGFLAGCFAFVDRTNNRFLFLDAARKAAESFWKARQKHRYFKPIPSGDVALFIASLAILNILYEVDPASITSSGVRKLFDSLRASSFPDNSEEKTCKVTQQSEPEMKNK